MIRFATAILDFSRKRGGAEGYLIDLCKRMANEEAEVHVYTESWEEEDRSIHFHRIKTPPFPKSLRLLSFAAKATQEIRAGNYDISFGVGNILSANVLQPHGGVHWAWFWRSLRAYEHPILWTIKFLGRVLSPKQWVNGWIEDAPYKGKSLPRIIAISDMVKRDIVKWYEIPGDRIDVIYNGVDIERFHPRNRQYRDEIRKRHKIGEEFVILFVSNNFRMKGLSYLIRALAKLKKEGCLPLKLIILGRDRRGPYLRLAKSMGILGEIIFAGSTPEPEKYYGSADLLVHPTFYDACSLTVLEALASGLPVITTSSNGASGMIRQGEEGWVIDKIKDVRELERAIRYFFDERIRHRIGHQGRCKAEAYSEEINFNHVKEILQGAIRH